MSALTLPGVSALPPQRLRREALSQWFTPPDLAARMVQWAGPGSFPRMLEPSAGAGAIAQHLRADRPEATIDCCEVDPDFAAQLRADGFTVHEGDYLTRHAPLVRYSLAVINPPYEGGQDGAFLAKVMRESDRVIALVRLACLAGGGRHESVWSIVESHHDGWHMPGLAILSSRPVFDGPESASGSAKSDFVVVKLSRIGTPEGTRVEWWT